MAAGEVLLNGTQLGVAGATGFELNKLLDGNALTEWSTNPTSPSWAGMDAGAVCFVTRMRLSPNGGFEDAVPTSILQGATDAGFLSPGVQSAANHINGTNNASITVTYASAQNSGDSNIVFVSKSASAVISGVSDSANGAYTLLTSGNNMSAWFRNNIAAATGGTNVVTCSFSTNSDFPSLHALEFAGITASPLDGSSSATGTSATPASGNFTTTSAQDIIVAFTVGGGQVSSAGPGFSLSTNEAPWDAATEWMPVNITGTYNPTFNLQASASWSCLALGLKTTVLSPVTMLTIAGRPNTGTLLNEYLINNGGLSYRYYRYYGSTGNFGSIADLDFIVTYTAGVTAACVQPVISPTLRVFDVPTLFSLSSITTDATMYYTLDGTTPTTSSTKYTGPFLVKVSSTLNAIAVSPGLTNSRVTSAQISIVADFQPLAFQIDNRNYRVWAVQGCTFFDPIGGFWYMYGNNLDEPGVVTSGSQGINAYQSADLKNWVFLGTVVQPLPGTQLNNAQYWARPEVNYNSATQTYVMWINAGTSYQVYTTTNPAGPWIFFTSYTSFNGFAMSGYDKFFFVDSDGVSAYLVFGSQTNNPPQIIFSKMNASWTAVDGVNFAAYNVNTTLGLFGQGDTTKEDGVHMWKHGSTYFLMASAQNNWTPTGNPYATASNPLGPWTNQGNPFVPVTGGSPDYTVAYGSQNGTPLLIPGRNATVYRGDAFNTGLAGNQGTSTTANFEASTILYLPISYPTPTSISIGWNPSWTLDSVFPTVSGAPKPASNLAMTGNTISWVNQEPKPANVYLDSTSDGVSNPISNVIPSGVTSFTDTYPFRLGVCTYVVRTVNANGTSRALLQASSPNATPITANGVYCSRRVS